MIVGSAEITIVRTFVVVPATFVAITENPNVASIVGVPEITPVVEFKFKPSGSLPLPIDQVIGVVPLALRVWLYDVPIIPPGKLGVVIIGTPDALLITMLKSFASFPALFVALTLKLYVPVIVGVPEISPEEAFKSKPGGRLPLAIDHVIGSVPLALRV